MIACYTEQIKTPERSSSAACELAAERRQADRDAEDRAVGDRAAVGAGAHRLAGRLGRRDRRGAAQARRHPRGHRRRPVRGAWRSSTPGSCRGAAGWRRSRSRAGPAGCWPTWRWASALDFPPLPPQTAAALRKVVPEYGNVGNPLDITGQGVFEPELARGAIEAAGDGRQPGHHRLGTELPLQPGPRDAGRADLERAVEQYPEIVFLVMSLVQRALLPGRRRGPGGRRAGQPPGRHPVLAGQRVEPEGDRGADPLRRVSARVAPARPTQEPRPRLAPASAGRRARALVRAAGGRSLTERESKAMLALYGIRTTARDPGGDSEHAVAAAERDRLPGRAQGRVAAAAPQERGWRRDAERRRTRRCCAAASSAR